MRRFLRPDAAQRGFEVVIAEDAIAHCNLRHRATIIEWLVAMYELRTMKVNELCASS